MLVILCFQNTKGRIAGVGMICCHEKRRAWEASPRLQLEDGAEQWDYQTLSKQDPVPAVSCPLA